MWNAAFLFLFFAFSSAQDCCPRLSIKLYNDVDDRRNQFYILRKDEVDNLSNKIDPGTAVYSNGDRIYLYCRSKIWFVSMTPGEYSGFAYSRTHSGSCPTESGWTNIDGALPNLIC
ncbi:unnamed protein product [Oikopleura dioica]|uniref:Uncharacterized protein n=1 Tax=Oikopleura dioica TaxID=34765 RepID=E4Y6X7_OIKDI|nr:unnamed protein product [Oikopleura dioica]